MKRSATCGSYTGYAPEERAKIGRYTAENEKSMQHAENTTVVVKLLPTKHQGSPLLLGHRLHQQPFCDVFGLGDQNPSSS